MPSTIMKGFLLTVCFAVKSMASIVIAALIPDMDQFHSVIRAVQDELGPSYRIEIIDMRENPTEAALLNRCKRADVKALIVMDSKAVKAAIGLQKLDSSLSAVPKFVYMTLLAKETAEGLKSACGINFEVPLFTLVTRFRIISEKEVSKVGIFYRKAYAPMIEETARLLSMEKITLHAECIDSVQTGKITQKTALKAMRDAFKKMQRGEKPDVFLATADNLVLNNASLNEFWIDEVKDRKIPIIAPLTILTSSNIEAAVFAIEPDLSQLGVQAANQITECMENGTSPTVIGFQQTISVISTINSKVAGYLGWKLKAGRLSGVDSIVK